MTKVSEHERQRRKAAVIAAAGRDVVVRPPVNLKRRRKALADPEAFLRTYFGHIFSQPMTAPRRAMIAAIVHAAKHGGDYAVAAPRGEGKSRLALFVLLWLLLKQYVKFPLLIGKNQQGAENELDTLKYEILNSAAFGDDFPEIVEPLRGLDGWASRARKQTVNGHPTNILWEKDCLLFPTVLAAALPADWSKRVCSSACGQGIAAVGIDGRIRGFNRRNMRPNLAVIDDVDDRSSARSATQTADHVVGIDQDVTGLAASGGRIARIMLCTIISSRCIAATYTAKPSWRGQRFAMLAKLPEREDLWAQYVELRRNRSADDPDARRAHEFYLANRKAMDFGAEVANRYAFNKKLGADGKHLEVSTLQACYNRIADIGWTAFSCEYQNDPPKAEATIKGGVTRELLLRRPSGFERREVPSDSKIVIGCDIGKFANHWTAGAFRQGGAGCIIDHGITENIGAENAVQQQTVEQVILSGLMRQHDDFVSNPYRDTDGNPLPISAFLIDAGFCQDAVVNFVQRFGGVYRATKGIGGGRFQHGRPGPSRIVGNHYFAQQQANGFWLFSLDADHWKRSVHDRFVVEPFDEHNRLRPGSLTLFLVEGTRGQHSRNTFISHIVAEEWRVEFTADGREKAGFLIHSHNNHWLDACSMMLAGAEMAGCGIFAQSAPATPPKPKVIFRGICNPYSKLSQ